MEKKGNHLCGIPLLAAISRDLHLVKSPKHIRLPTPGTSVKSCADCQDTLNLASRLEAAGASVLCLHGRTKARDLEGAAEGAAGSCIGFKRVK